jgi:Xaa-Pro aminopeptidase
MVAEGLDYLIGFPNSGHWGAFQAEVAYLAPGCASEGALVLPVAGPPTAIAANDPGAHDWAERQSWISDIRSGSRRWGEPVVANLKERGFQRGRLGVMGLLHYLRAPEGVVPWGSVQRLAESFPNAHIQDATDLIMGCRVQKSDEEVAIIRQADLLAEKAAAAMVDAAAEPSATSREVLARIHYTMARNGGESSMVLFHAGPPRSLHMASSALLPLI